MDRTVTAAVLQITFLVAAVYAVVWWAERTPRRRHEADCDICARRPR